MSEVFITNNNDLNSSFVSRFFTIDDYDLNSSFVSRVFTIEHYDLNSSYVSRVFTINDYDLNSSFVSKVFTIDEIFQRLRQYAHYIKDLVFGKKRLRDALFALFTLAYKGITRV